MLNITNISSRLAARTIDPTIIVSGQLNYDGGAILPMRLDAELGMGNSAESTRICGMAPVISDNLVNNESFRLAFAVPGVLPREQQLHFEFFATLTEKHLDAIETARALQPKGDVFLTLKFGLQYLEHGLGIHSLGAREANVAEVADKTKLLQAKFWTTSTWFKIPGSDWAHDYSPGLGIGKFMVVEIPQPRSLPTAGAAFADRVPKALSALERARHELRSGEWPEVIKALRPVWELLREVEEIKKLLIADSIPEAAATEFRDALQSLFNLASKFDHALERDRKTLQPDIKAQKEDAYFAFSVASASLNLITRKGFRQST
ncbi:MAG: hypothetical protein C5B47_04175 [Verrucomicrobia bacterium]|nr:MAG: hypothetical protein C5B47_04175 [Verrucomicrobiota bacterium]